MEFMKICVCLVVDGVVDCSNEGFYEGIKFGWSESMMELWGHLC